MTGSDELAEIKKTVALRRVPKQQRSRARYGQILAAARALIGKRGNDGVSMREIADFADVPIASVYQYFPDKNVLLWTLLSKDFQAIESRWLENLDEVTSLGELQAASAQLFDAFVALCHADPVIARLWSSIQANVVLTQLDRELNQRIADAYTDKFSALVPFKLTKDERTRIRRASFLMASLSSTALQLAFDKAPYQSEILDEFRLLMRLQSKQLMQQFSTRA